MVFLSTYLLRNINHHLQQNQSLYIAGGFDDPIGDTVWSVRGNGQPEPNPRYTSNAEEADTRVWLHIYKTEQRKVLLVSPDTDVYHVGLPLELGAAEKQVMVQISPFTTRELKIVDLSALQVALRDDPDLSYLPTSLLNSIMQTLYVCTGCDYVSFFSGIGKATFLKHFFGYATFITSGNPQGTLADTALQGETYEHGYLAFLRLIGTVYYKRYSTAFDYPSPAAHFHQFHTSDTTTLQHHQNWINSIRKTIWERTTYENGNIPSNDALLLHWKRSCWVIDMWRQANANKMTLEPLTNFGWQLDDDDFKIMWDSPSNIQRIKTRVQELLHGCKCKTGCSTIRCSCKRLQKTCTEGCECRNCTNYTESSDSSDSSADEPDEEETTCSEEVEGILNWVFGSD